MSAASTTSTSRIWLQPDPAEIVRAIGLICNPGSVYEVRAPRTAKATVSGFYNDFDKLARDAVALSSSVTFEAPGVYLTLNPVAPALLSRANNRLESFCKLTSADADVVKRCWLPIDLDAKRVAGISSTDAEHEAAIQHACEVREWLDALGWPAPIIADSGNGGHLLYGIALPNDADSTKLVKRVLETLAQRFSDDAVSVDVGVHNPARIWKLYGSVARKGDHTPDRPHRLASIIDAPDQLELVTREQLEANAALFEEPAPRASKNGKGHSYSKFDLDEFIARSSIPIKRIDSYNGGRRFILERCVFDFAHAGSSAAIIELASGALVYKCQHAGCTEKKWADLRELYEPSYRDRAYSNGNSSAGESPTQVNSAGRIELPADAPFEIADALLKSKFERDGVRTLYHWQGGFWRWNGRNYEESDELRALIGNYLHAEVLLTTEGKKGPKIVPPTSWHTRNVYDAATARSHLSSSIEPPVWLGHQSHRGVHMVACANGLLDLETRELKEPTPDFFNTVAIAASYRKEATCPQWLEFLASVWPQDRQSIDSLQEVFGYLLEPDNSQQKIIMLIGPTRSGKGTIANTIDAVLGRPAIARPSLADFTQTFGLESLIGKSVAIVSDARLDRDANVSLAVERMLSISGNDNPSIGRKYKKAYTGPTSTCRIFIVTNELPGMMDSSGALAARVVMLRTFIDFLGRENINLFKGKILPEIDGVLVWAIDGWHRLRKRGHFVVPDSAQGLLESFAEQSDRLSAFASDCVNFVPESVLEKSVVYDRYVEWARNHDQKALGADWFFRALGSRRGVDCAYRYDEATGTSRTARGKSAPRRVKGIRLRPDPTSGWNGKTGAGPDDFGDDLRDAEIDRLAKADAK